MIRLGIDRIIDKILKVNNFIGNIIALRRSELVSEGIESGDFSADSLSLSDAGDEFSGSGGRL